MSDGQSQAGETSQTGEVIEAAAPAVPPAVGYKSPVRLRKPERSQVKMRICCDDDLIAAESPGGGDLGRGGGDGPVGVL